MLWYDLNWSAPIKAGVMPASSNASWLVFSGNPSFCKTFKGCVTYKSTLMNTRLFFPPTLYKPRKAQLIPTDQALNELTVGAGADSKMSSSHANSTRTALTVTKTWVHTLITNAG